MGAPGFWDDQAAAAQVSAEHARATRRLERWRGARSATSRTSRRWSSWPTRTTRSPPRSTSSSPASRSAWPRSRRSGCSPGRYDAGDALVTVNAGAGGTDAQDWAEMVLRMMMRWAERRGFKVELLEASAGGGGRHQVGDLPRRGRERLRALQRREGRPPARAPVARSTPPTAARRRSPASRSRRSSRTSATIEIDDDDLQIDTYRASGAGGQHVNKTDSAVRITHRPSGHRRAVPERALAVGQQGHGDEDAAREAARARGAQAPRRRSPRERGEAQDVNFGSQIRSYVLHPYTMVKDHRTNFEMGDAQRVLDGDLDGFVRAELLRRPAAGRARGRMAGEPRREQPTAPYLDAVVGYGFRGPGRFHVPGHKGGPGADPGLRYALGDRALRLDIPQDIRGRRPRPVADALRARPSALAAEAYGAARTWFLTNGATQGNHALCLALAPLGAHVVAQRNSHASLVDGLVLSAAACPTFVAARVRRGARAWRTASRPRRSRAALARDARRAGGVHRLADLLRDGRRRRRAAPRSPTPPACRSSSTSRGARTSASTTALPPSALHARRRRRAHEHAQDRRLADAERDAARRPRRPRSTPARVGRAPCGSCARRRPSSLLMASLDARAPPARGARRAAAARDARRRSSAARAKLATIAGDRAGRPGASSAARASPATTRCGSSLDVRGTGRTGYEVADALRRSYDVHAELATQATIVLRRRHRRAAARRCCAWPATSRRSSSASRAEGATAADRPPAGDAAQRAGRRAARGVPRRRRAGRASTTPSGASRASRSPATRRASRRCCRASASSAETVAYLRELVASGARLHGASDPRFERVHVLVEGVVGRPLGLWRAARR